MSRLEKSIIIIGAISSGKSTVAKYIADKYNVPIASFGGFLKDHSLRHHLPTDRKSLQDMGDDFIKNQPEKFLLDVIEFSGAQTRHLIFEGVRHRVIFDLLKKHSSHTLSIFLDVPYDVRKQRYLLRNKDIDIERTSQQFEIANSHIVELEIPSLKKFCDLTIDSVDDSRLEISLRTFSKA